MTVQYRECDGIFVGDVAVLRMPKQRTGYLCKVERFSIQDCRALISLGTARIWVHVTDLAPAPFKK